jgi:hypothetical protein
VPSSLVATSTPKIVKEACRRLIEACGPGGGYILAGASSISKCDPANLHTMIEAAEEYGKY